MEEKARMQEKLIEYDTNGTEDFKVEDLQQNEAVNDMYIDAI